MSKDLNWVTDVVFVAVGNAVIGIILEIVVGIGGCISTACALKRTGVNGGADADGDGEIVDTSENTFSSGFSVGSSLEFDFSL